VTPWARLARSFWAMGVAGGVPIVRNRETKRL